MKTVSHTPASNDASADTAGKGSAAFDDLRPEASEQARQIGMIRSAAAPVQMKIRHPVSKSPMTYSTAMKVFDEKNRGEAHRSVYKDIAANVHVIVDFNAALEYAKNYQGAQQMILDKVGNQSPGKFIRAYNSVILEDVNWKTAYEQVEQVHGKEVPEVIEEITALEQEEADMLGTDPSPSVKASYTRTLRVLNEYLDLLNEKMGTAMELKEDAERLTGLLVQVLRNPSLSEGRKTRNSVDVLPTSESIIQDLSSIRSQLEVIYRQLSGMTGLARSMSAKGRARERTGNTVDIGTASPMARSLFENIVVDGATPDKVFEPDNTGYDAPVGVLTFGGIKLDSLANKNTQLDRLSKPQGASDAQDIARITANVDGLPKAEEQTVVYTSQSQKRDRGSGQAPAMLNTNAAAYAFGKGLIDQNDTGDWEWLHIRAASLGGVTDSTNLVPGLSDANTLMMPVESHINELSKLSASYQPLTVTYKPEAALDGNGHAFNYITIEWSLTENNPFGTGTKTKQTGAAKFDITHGRVVAKTDIELLEQHLKAKREGLK